ncbi:GAF domain-containing protein [Fuscovulum ytuae]|uniref:GAF domain-containing protein n=1 Tax=Fuscovulum ytuae TaxID=3042299 RepID=A0ABY8Q389_9RHOB|nr:GAF domain-containing protein [Fuscovulum sp. YMD61]WGV15320.1 GAF domain-containing protein [Fuscovulum sp. YMD61]
MSDVFVALHQDCAALGARLFTITTHDLRAGLFRRAYTSHPQEYPTHGTKPLERDAWYDLCIRRAKPFVANSPDAFATVFFDHALITAMGLGSAANLPVIAPDGAVPGTVNLLAEAQHFTQDRLAAYSAILERYKAALLLDPGFILA